MTATAHELRAERDALQRERPTLQAVGEVRKMRARTDRARQAGPLAGVGVEYDGTIVGLAGVTHADQAAERLAAIDARLTEIEAELPEAEQREQQAADERREREAQRAVEREAAALDAARAAADRAADHAREVEAALRALDALLADSAVATLLGAQTALRAALLDVDRAIASAGTEAARERVRKAVGEPPAAPASTGDYAWLVSALLRVPQLEVMLKDLSIAVAQIQARR